MKSINDLMALGFQALRALRLGDSYATALAAAGSAQGDATALTATVNHVTTTAAGTGVRLMGIKTPAAAENTGRVTIRNDGANALLVYPATGETINARAINAAATVAAGTGADFVAVSPTQWLQV